MTLSWLLARFEKFGEAPAFLWQGGAYSYAWMHREVSRWQPALQAHGLRRACGAVVALEADYTPEACALLLALIRENTIVAPLTPSSDANRESLLEIAEIEWRVIRDSEKSWRFERRPIRPSHPLTCQLRDQGLPGLILFSSGSTGASKAILHDFSRLLEKFKQPRPAPRMIPFLLFDHIGGINTLFHQLANGGTLVPVADRSPDTVCEIIARHEVELLPTSPTFLNMLLLSEAYRRHDLGSLKRITYGTEPMPEATLRRLKEALPTVNLSQTYGLSELGILRTKSKASDSLLVKVGGEGFETKVVDGLLWIRARSAMLGYLNAPSPFNADGWLNTGDEVQVEGDYFRILGRRCEIINVGGEKAYPAEIEGVIAELPNIAEVTVCGETNPITGQMVVARITLSKPEDLLGLRRRVRQACRNRLAAWKVPAKVLITDQTSVGPRLKKLRRTVVQ